MWWDANGIPVDFEAPGRNGNLVFLDNIEAESVVQRESEEAAERATLSPATADPYYDYATPESEATAAVAQREPSEAVDTEVAMLEAEAVTARNVETKRRPIHQSGEEFDGAERVAKAARLRLVEATTALRLRLAKGRAMEAESTAMAAEG